MNNKKFERMMNAVDDELLEEAQRPVKKSKVGFRVVSGLVACMLLVVAARFATPEEKGGNGGNTMIVNPIRKVSAAEIRDLGYELPVPESATEPSYYVIDSGQEGSVPLAEVRFEQNGTAYTCRTKKTGQAEDISGIYASWIQDYQWDVDTLKVELTQAEDQTACVGWYEEESGMQWCLSGGTDALALMHTAQEIVNTLGYDMTVSPADAENVSYQALELDGLSVGETVFTWNGITYTYRTAATGEIEENFADISGVEGEYVEQPAGEVLWCPARIYLDANGAGKIVWFDVVPGLLYSLHMDQDASVEALLDMAELVFDPAQGF